MRPDSAQLSGSDLTSAVLVSPTFFDIDDQDLVVLLKEDVSEAEAEVEEVRRAAYDCPSESIQIKED